jgi:hypothetical protein
MSLLVALALMVLPVFLGGYTPGSEQAFAQGKLKLAILGKVSKEQSARRFEYLFPKLSANFREAFAQDARFDLMSPAEVERALADSGIAKGKLNPDDAAQLRKIGKQAGADLVFVSYYYEMGGHAMPMHSNNVLILVWVGREEMVKVDRDYSLILSEDELISSDGMAFKDLMKKAEPLL